jgi:EAL domain-containing protein (putative c-di-GMP-specific phosphodiesterase class I)
MLPMSAGYCQHIVEERLPELIPDTRTIPLAMSIPETTEIPIGAHLSVPIRLEGGRVFGTFCCLSHEARPDLNEHHLELIRTFAQLVATELAADVAVHGERERKRAQIRAALSAGDPALAFQPIVRLSDLSLTGAEALSRFSAEPKRTPDLWFADAHDAGIGDELELLAVEKALRAGAALPERVYVSVNVSPDTLVAADLTKAFANCDPSRTVIEITEHRPIQDYEPILRALSPLRKSGLRVAIDDAGAGYSSLRHVLAMRPDIIKFDVSLTRNLDRDPMRKAMVAALAEFGSRTGTAIVAEGVETTEELTALRELGVPFGQGFALGRPEPLLTIIEAGGRKWARPNG